MKVHRQIRITILVCTCNDLFFQCEEIADFNHSSFDFAAIIIIR